MTDLTDRMRTCAAYIMSRPHDAPMPTEHLLDDAADLLIEASNLLVDAAETLERGAYDLRLGGYLRSATVLEEEAAEIKGEPMEVIPPVVIKPKPPATEEQLVGTWIAPGGPLPAPRLRSPHACPKCDSRANKTVRRDGNRLMLICPVCAETWEFKR